MRALIAFGGRPNAGFLDTLVKLAKDDGVNITGAILCPGPGCWNLGIIVDSSDAENFVNRLTMALMPAKWETCDNDDRLIEGLFITEAE